MYADTVVVKLSKSVDVREMDTVLAPRGPNVALVREAAAAAAAAAAVIVVVATADTVLETVVLAFRAVCTPANAAAAAAAAAVSPIATPARGRDAVTVLFDRCSSCRRVSLDAILENIAVIF